MTTRRAFSGIAQPRWLGRWQEQVLSRRRFLLSAAGGGLGALFPLAASAATDATSLDEASRWSIIGAVQDHLFPSEPSAPGAREIHALSYLRWVVGDDTLDAGHRAFILRGAEWVSERSVALEEALFLELGEAARERVLREVAATGAGENWLSTLLMYLFEALLTDPVYGGNPNAIGWNWLGHTPGFPRPPAGKRYWEL